MLPGLVKVIGTYDLHKLSTVVLLLVYKVAASILNVTWMMRSRDLVPRPVQVTRARV